LTAGRISRWPKSAEAGRRLHSPGQYPTHYGAED
jgi:hypothetical protein